MLNTLEVGTAKSAVWSEIPQLRGGQCFNVLNVWTDEEIGCVKDRYTARVGRHDIAAIIVGGRCDCD